MKTIKQFFTRKRCKSFKLLNQKGFSLIEIMVALGLITLLTALAVPQYNNYKKSVRYGVVRSMLLIPHRTAEIEGSLGNGIASLTEADLLSKIKSKDKGDFTATFNTDSGNTKWCFLMEGNTGTGYNNIDGCINESGNIIIGGDDVPCSQAKEFKRDKDSTAGTKDCSGSASKNCPTGCKRKDGVPATVCTDDTTKYADCVTDTTSTFSGTISCASGECTTSW